ncbi:hypothetical protein PanWU01x14_015520, partial [Parasponia andersonii]
RSRRAQRSGSNRSWEGRNMLRSVVVLGGGCSGGAVRGLGLGVWEKLLDGRGEKGLLGFETERGGRRRLRRGRGGDGVGAVGEWLSNSASSSSLSFHFSIACFTFHRPKEIYIYIYICVSV